MTSAEDQPKSVVSGLVDKYVADTTARMQAQAEADRLNILSEEEHQRRHALIFGVKASIATLLATCIEVPDRRWSQSQRVFEPVPMGRFVLALPYSWMQDQNAPRSVFVQPLIKYDLNPENLSLLSLNVYAAGDPTVSTATGVLNQSGRRDRFDCIATRNIRKEDFYEDYFHEGSETRYFGRAGLECLEGFAPLLNETLAHVQAPAEA